MTTVAQVIRTALGHLGVQDPRQPVKAEDARDCMEGMNNMIRRWEADGVSIGWQDVTSVDDEMPVPPEAIEAIGFNLAVKMRAHFRAVLEVDVVTFAAQGLSALSADVLANQYERVSYDDLPAGNNQQRYGWREAYTR